MCGCTRRPPGETVPVRALPGDDLVVVAMAADFSAPRPSHSSVVTGPESSPMSEIDDVPVPGWTASCSGRRLPRLCVSCLRHGAAHAQVRWRHDAPCRHVRARRLCGSAIGVTVRTPGLSTICSLHQADAAERPPSNRRRFCGLKNSAGSMHPHCEPSRRAASSGLCSDGRRNREDLWR